MKRKNQYSFRKRLVAGFLAIVMSLSLFTGMGFIGYAAEVPGDAVLSSDISLNEDTTSGNVTEDTSGQDEKKEDTNAGDEESKEESKDDVTKGPEDDSDGTDHNENNENQDSEGESTDSETEEILEDDLQNSEEEGGVELDIVLENMALDGAEDYSNIAEETVYAIISSEDNVEHEYQVLVIHESWLPEDKGLTLEILESILQSKGKKYPTINLELRDTDDRQINKNLYNACIPYLDDTDYVAPEIEYEFINASGLRIIEFEFNKPYTISGNLDGNVSITEESSEFYLNLTKGAYSNCANYVTIRVPVAQGSELIEKINSKFGEDTEGLFLYSGKDKIPSVSVNLQRYEPEFTEGMCLSVFGANTLSEGKYLIDKQPLRAYNERTYNGKTYLYIRLQDGIYTCKEGEVKTVLEKYHQGKSYDYIDICILSGYEGWEIRTDIYNAAIPYLKDGGEISYYCQPNENLYSTIWHFQNPSELKEDAAPVITLIAGENTGTIRMTNISDFSAELIGMTAQAFYKSENEVWKNIFGDYAQLSLFKENSETPVEDVYVYWTIGNGGSVPAQFNIWGVEKLEENVTYTIADYTYRGDVWEENGRKDLHISSMALEKDKFTMEDLTSIINWYKDKGELFDHITLEEKYSTNNLIKKDYFNLASSILRECEDSGLTFTFCRCEEAGQNDLNWNFNNCKQGITKDINGNVTLTTVEDYGATFQLNAANTYPSGNVEVQFYMAEDIVLADQMKAALGEPGRGSGDAPLAALKGTTALTDLYASYAADDNGMWLSICDVPKWTAKTKYIILPVYETDCFNVGESLSFAELSERLQIPENASNIIWSSLTAEVLSVADGKLSVLDKGEGYALLSYKVGKNSCMRLYLIPTEKWITSIVMNKKELTMDLEYAADNTGSYVECTAGLDLKVYPAEAGCDISNPGEIKWESSDSKVVKIIVDEHGRFKGIQAVGPGTAVVTATYIGDNKNDNGPAITTSCPVTVRAPHIIENMPDASGELYAITNFDTTLSAVELPNGWEWVNGSTSLSAFSGMEGSAFPAVYTDVSGRKETYNLWVRMITITGIQIYQVEKNENNTEMTIEPELFIEKSGGEKTITYIWKLQFASEVPSCAAEWQALSTKWEKAGYKTVWSSNPKNLGAAVADNSAKWQFTVDDKTAKGKKTFTATIQDAKKKKVFAASHSLTVTEKPVVEFPDSVMDISEIDEEDGIFTNQYDESTGKGQLIITIPKEQYSKLTVTSKDAAILKTGKISVVTGDENVVTTVPYERKGYGIVPVVITAADEKKSSCTLRFTFVDATPKLLTPTVTLNKKQENALAEIRIQCEKGYPAIEEVEIEEKYREIFDLSYGIDEEGFEDNILLLSLQENADIKKGKYKVKITVPLKDGEQKVLTVTVSVVETLPSVTMKQTKKVNTFYTDEEGYGLFSITAKDAEIEDVWLDDKCDYELVASDDIEGEYRVKPKEDTTGKVKKGTLSYTLVGYQGTYTKSFTISTVNTKPVIVLSQKSDTLYPGAGYGKTSLVLTDKVTGEPVSFEDIWVKNVEDKQYKELISDGLRIKGSNKNYYVISEGDDGCLDIQLEGTQIYSSTDKIPFKIQKDNWNSAIDVTYSVKVDTKAPKLKLSQTTVTLNKNEDVYAYQQVKTKLSLSGCSTILGNSEEAEVRVYFTGKDKASTNALKVNSNLVLQYWDDQGCIVARFNDNELKTGTYKYNVCVEIRPDSENPEVVIKAATVLTIKVVDTKPEKCISVSTKDSIDVLDREGTSIAITPKLSNATGTVTDGWLTDKDGSLFESYFEDGKLYIRAREGEIYSTKHTYKVKAAFWVQTEDYHGYELVSKELSFKVKQGKPKIKISSEMANTLYRTTGNEIELKIEALLGTKAVEIEEVNLVNYTDDLELLPSKPDENVWCITTTGQTKNIMQNGKTWSVKLAVRYLDQAGDVKDTQVTYKICVR